MRRAVVALALGLAGCHAFSYQTTGPSSEVESALLSYTTEYAAKLGVNVKGEIVTNRTTCQAKDEDAAWYTGGIAYYYRPDVEQYITLIDGECPAAPRCELASGIAAHEVCHAKWPMHDVHHWCCMVNLGVRPTYPPPTTVQGQWPTCEEFR